MASLPDITPDRMSTKTNKTRILKNDFGDGYSQRAADGLNSILEEWNLTWYALTDTQATTLADFFSDHGGYQSFTWVPYRGTTAKKFIVREWRRDFVGPDNDTITAKLEEVFDLSS